MVRFTAFTICKGKISKVLLTCYGLNQLHWLRRIVIKVLRRLVPDSCLVAVLVSVGILHKFFNKDWTTFFHFFYYLAICWINFYPEIIEMSWLTKAITLIPELCYSFVSLLCQFILLYHGRANIVILGRVAYLQWKYKFMTLGRPVVSH